MRHSFNISSAACAGLALALAVGGAASAEMRLKVTNANPNPATFTLEGKSKDIRPRKSMSFPLTSDKPEYSVYFANGLGDRGVLDLGYATPVVSEKDGDSYRCLTLQEDGMEIEQEEDCQKRINKK